MGVSTVKFRNQIEREEMARRRKVREEEEEEERNLPKEKDGFFACYLLCSLCPRHKGRTYIGFTVNPRRRIRQHNGEIRCGAVRTKKGRPWEMILCIHGFPSNVSALQFEWAWQHPVESLAVRKAASNFKSLNGVANKIKLAYTMLNLPSWENLNLTVNFFSTKYTKFTAGCPKLPNRMKTEISAMDELPCYNECYSVSDENSDEEDEPAPLKNYENAIDEPNCLETDLGQLEDGFSPRISSGEGSNDTEDNGSVDEEVIRDYIFEEHNFNAKEDMFSPKGYNCEGSSNNNYDGDFSPETNVINLVTPSSLLVRSGRKRNKRVGINVIDLTSSPCVIEL